MTDILTLLQVLPPPNPIEEAASTPEIITFDVERILQMMINKQ